MNELDRREFPQEETQQVALCVKKKLGKGTYLQSALDPPDVLSDALAVAYVAASLAAIARSSASSLRRFNGELHRRLHEHFSNQFHK
ncbi:hypothetical protein PsorP6_017067 [Peronosclerospora sorghi]|uniref:Uncharacterized protein n=1 Tax=Peronosclerospora sorghi TaxID=230839 RepID=A0ACC0WFB3_9STRA|nr:hypothetical protein PsorP6_017067 [Peronosclerospora sorghi]